MGGFLGSSGMDTDISYINSAGLVFPPISDEMPKGKVKESKDKRVKSRKAGRRAQLGNDYRARKFRQLFLEGKVPFLKINESTSSDSPDFDVVWEEHEVALLERAILYQKEDEEQSNTVPEGFNYNPHNYDFSISYGYGSNRNVIPKGHIRILIRQVFETKSVLCDGLLRIRTEGGRRRGSAVLLSCDFFDLVMEGVDPDEAAKKINDNPKYDIYTAKELKAAKKEKSGYSISKGSNTVFIDGVSYELGIPGK